MNDFARVVPVQIQGQRYPVRTTLDAEYVARLAAFVDQRIQAAAEATPTSDALGLAILAALNIADELFRMNEARDTADGRIAERAEELERLLDSVLSA